MRWSATIFARAVVGQVLYPFLGVTFHGSRPSPSTRWSTTRRIDGFQPAQQCGRETLLAQQVGAHRECLLTIWRSVLLKAVRKHRRQPGVPARRLSARRRPAGHADEHLQEEDLLAYEVDKSSDELVVYILGVFHGGLDWEAALGEGQGDPEAGR
jgi:hypothetical protein